MKIMTVFGTRPEAIKMAPIVRELGRRSAELHSVTCVTAQHRQMLDQVLNVFQIRPDIDLNLMHEKQTPASLTAMAVSAITAVLHAERPDLVLVQGDTTTAMATTLAAFYEKIPVGHVEAGLRTHNRYSPFPEEINRRIIGMLGEFHFAPTDRAVENLRREGTPKEKVFMTGNTVIDALLWVTDQEPSDSACELFKLLGFDDCADDGYKRNIPANGDGPDCSGESLKTILVTAHRRENFGAPMEDICLSLKQIARRNRDVQIVYPVHLNPPAGKSARRYLAGQERILLIDPLPYEMFAQLLKRVYLVLTDSGGIQEEAPALGKPVLVLRSDTERPEAVEAGCAKIVGTDPERIVGETERLLRDSSEYKRMAQCINPYGDGYAANLIVDAILANKEALRSEQKVQAAVAGSREEYVTAVGTASAAVGSAGGRR